MNLLPIIALVIAVSVLTVQIYVGYRIGMLPTWLHNTIYWLTVELPEKYRR